MLTDTLRIVTTMENESHVEATMPITPEFHQPFGFLHGGATIALLETVASVGTERNTDFDKERPFGIDVHVRHRKSGKSGTLRGVADLARREGNKLFWTVVAYDDEGDVVSDGEIMTKIVSLERLAEKQKERENSRG